jgi:hypothetical protein
MPPTSTETHKRFAAITSTLLSEAGVSIGASEKRTFGSSALKVNGRIFAMVTSKGLFVVKLPRTRVDALTSEGRVRNFDPGHGRPMKQWCVVETGTAKDWVSLAREAMAFVAQEKAPP